MTLTLWGVTLHELDVAATDLLLCLEAWAFAGVLARSPAATRRCQALGVGLFVTLGGSSLLGAAFHAFFPGKADGSTGGYLVWIATGVAIAATTAAVWYLDALLLGRGPLVRRLEALVPVYFLAFIGTLVFVDYRFSTIIAFYAPAIAALAIIAVARYAATRSRASLYLVLGTGLSFAAAAVQVLKVDLHPRYFNFNALYHAVQGVALVCFFAALRRLQAGEAQSRGRSGSS